jgi:NAD(P)-dependent dehydrogenase (short-subunit alcohol dehydrogenase family)
METAIIAGVEPGLGTFLTHGFAGQRYAVALLSRSSETSTGVAEEIVRANGKALVVQTDVTRLESVKTRGESQIRVGTDHRFGIQRQWLWSWRFLRAQPKNNPTIF